ncbi:MAG: glycosyltransferase family 9 protein [bacterium]|nr:glycosyltransferase family 9 protein [bacterium]
MTRASVKWQLANVSSRGVVALFIASRRPYKRWPLESFAELVELLRGLHVPEIVLVGSIAEEPEMRAFAQLADLPPQRVIGCESLGVLAAVIKRATLLIGNDGGPKHLATALGTATVTIFRHDPPEYWTPPNHPLHLAVRTDEFPDTASIVRAAVGIYEAALG